MSVDPGLASLSDTLLTLTVLSYALAMLGYAIEFAFGARGLIGHAAGQAAAQPARELVAAGAGEVAAADTDGALLKLPPEDGSDDWARRHTALAGGAPTLPVPDGGSDSSRPGLGVSPRHAVLLGKAALWLTVLGALTQAGALTARGFAAGRVPWGNMYEFVIAICLVGVVAWIALAFRRPVRHLGVFVTLVVVLLLGFAAVRLYTQAGPLVPALNSYWLKIHVSTAILATGVLLTGFVTAALYLLRDRYAIATAPAGSRAEAPHDPAERPALRFPVTLGARLPAAETLERIAFRLHALAFPVWTFAIIAGAIWAEEAWTRYWAWDPKETWAFISWVVYAAYLHARATAGWKRSTAAWIAVIGWITMMINLFVVNLVIEGLHSYSGV